jgi:hypothetical protein
MLRIAVGRSTILAACDAMSTPPTAATEARNAACDPPLLPARAI